MNTMIDIIPKEGPKQIFDFTDFNQTPIEYYVDVMEWRRRKDTVGKMLIGGNHRKDENNRSHVDIYAELTLDEYYDSIELAPKYFFYDWSIHGGRGVPPLLPLYAYYHNEDLNKYDNGLFLLSAQIKCGSIAYPTDALFHTGASMTHMTSTQWVESGMAEQFLKENKNLCNLMGFYDVTDFGKIRDQEAERKGKDSFLLPMKEFSTGVGDGTRRRTYQMRLDELILHKNTLGSQEPVILKNIDTRIIESTQSSLMVGENVINYLTTQMGPIDDDFHIMIDFTEHGRQLMEKHRKTKNINAMQEMYILDEQAILA